MSDWFPFKYWIIGIFLLEKGPYMEVSGGNIGEQAYRMLRNTYRVTMIIESKLDPGICPVI